MTLLNNFICYFLSFPSSLFHLQPIGNRTLRSLHPDSAVRGSLTALSLSPGPLSFFLCLHSSLVDVHSSPYLWLGNQLLALLSWIFFNNIYLFIYSYVELFGYCSLRIRLLLEQSSLDVFLGCTHFFLIFLSFLTYTHCKYFIRNKISAGFIKKKSLINWCVTVDFKLKKKKKLFYCVSDVLTPIILIDKLICKSLC